jgi:serine/threonine protein kinase
MLKAGRSFGEGLKGITMDIACKKYNAATLCRKLKLQDIEEINLISFHKTYSISKEEFTDFIDFLSHLNKFVIKIFKPYPSVLRYLWKAEKNNFKNEIKGIKKIFKIFEGDLEKYTTLKVVQYKDMEFIGIQIKLKTDTVYGTVSSKCDHELEDHKFTSLNKFHKFIKQTLEALIIIQKHDYSHTDIKQSNIIYCSSDDSYKIIDWELLKPLSWYKSKQYFANKTHNNPLTLYIYGMPVLLALETFTLMNQTKHPEWYESNFYKEIYNKLDEELHIIIKNKSEHQLFREYKYTFDLFALGMTYAQLLIKNKLHSPKLHKFILKITSLTNYFKNAEEALDYFNQV